MCETEAVGWSFNKVGRQADTLTYCGVRPDSIEAKSNQIRFIRDKSNPIGFREHTDYGQMKAKSLILCSPNSNEYLGCGYKGLIVFCRKNS